MHTQKASAKVVGLVVKLCAFAKGGETRVSGEESSFERSRDVGRRVKESESREKGGDFTGGGEVVEARKRWRKGGGSSCWIRRLLARAFGTRLSGTRFVTDPSFPFFHFG